VLEEAIVLTFADFIIRTLFLGCLSLKVVVSLSSFDYYFHCLFSVDWLFLFFRTKCSSHEIIKSLIFEN